MKNNTQTSLKFFASIPKKERSGFDLKKAQVFVAIMEKSAIPGQAPDYKKIAGVVAKRLDIKFVESGAQNLTKELQKAYAAGHTLEKYFELKRPFKYGNQIANKKPNEPKK